MPDDQHLLIEAARAGGALARRYFENGAKSWTKNGHEPVSEADMAVDALLHERLAGTRRAYGWLSEETEDNPARLTRQRVWVVDPIDGTRAFLKGKPHFTISIALVEDGAPVLAAVYNPIREELFTARRGAGAWLNDTPVHISQRADLAHCRMLAHDYYFKPGKWRDPWPAMTLGMVNSIAYRLAMVGAGHYDACLTLRPKSDWDIAAGDLIVREAGGCCTDGAGRRFVYNQPTPTHRNVIAANPALHRQIIAKIAAGKSD